jgi:hypothetical protein
MVSVLAIGPKVRRLNPGRGDELLRAIRSSLSFGEEVKPAATCREILRQVKELYETLRDISKVKSIISFPILLICYYMTAGTIISELTWKNLKFSPVHMTPPWISMLVWGLNNWPTGGRSSET